MKVARKPGPRELRGPDPLYTTLQFTDGLKVDTTSCPRAIHARSHWAEDGRCRCEEGKA